MRAGGGSGTMLHCIIFIACLFVSSVLLHRRAFAAFGALGMLLAPTSCAPAAESPAALTLAVGRRDAFVFRHLPLDIAQTLDFFTPEGVAVSLQPYASDLQALQAVQRGAADVCAVDFEQLLRHSDISRDLDARCFVLQGRAPQAALGISKRWLARFGTLKDAPLRRVGVSSLGSLSHTVACLALIQASVSPAAIVFVPLSGEKEAADALRAGRVQALCHGDLLMTRLEQQGDVRIVSDARTLSGTQSLFAGSVPGGCLVAPAAFLQKRAAHAQALTHGMVHALKWLQTASPADIVKMVPPLLSSKGRSVYLSAFASARETFSPDGMMPEGGAGTALRALALAAPDTIANRIQLDRRFTQDFARKAKAKFSA